MTWPLALGLALGLLQDASALSKARNLGVAHYERGDYGLAVASFESVLEADTATARDAFNAGMAALQNQDIERALAHFTTARQMDPSFLEAEFGLGVLYKRQLLNPRALELFERVSARDPNDPCTWLNLGVVRQAMGQAEAAEQAFDRVVALGPARGANFYASALFRKANLLARRGEREEAKRLFETFESLRAGIPGEALTPAALENGVYGRVRAPVVAAADLAEPRQPVELEELASLDAPVCERDFPPPSLVLGDYDRDGLVDLFVASPCGGSRLYRNEGGGGLRDVTREAGLQAIGPISGALFFDDEASDCLSLYVWSRDDTTLLRSREGSYVDETTSAELPRDAGPAIPVDLDRDGQLDLFLLGNGVLRNDGDGTFSWILEGSRGEGREAVAADFDEDGFVDVVVGLESGEALLVANEGGRALRSLPIRFGGRHLAVLDIDRDGWLDVVAWEDEELVALRNVEGRLRPSGPASRALEDRWLVPLGGSLVPGPALVEASLPRGLLSPAAAVDLDGDGRTTVFLVTAEGHVRRFRETRPAPGWIRVALEGKRSNRSAVGAIVEIKAGLFYRKQIYDGLPLTFDTRGRDRLDVVRITWTNGVVQNAIDVPTGVALEIEEEDRQTSSCPFLYVWDGERFRFLTDVVGRAPLGEITPEGGLVTPNPDDDVRIPPGTLKPRDGRYRLQITEELRELAFLDGVALVALDHPAGIDIFTDESFHAPPFEAFRPHATRDLRPPLSASDGGREDVLDLVASADGRYLAPRLHPVPGFAHEHALVLESPFAGEGDGFALLLSGFVEWPSSSSMRALATNETFAPRPPSLQVEDGAGGWTTLVEDLGLPSGIDRTLVVDLDGRHRRYRVVTNFAVYWDRAVFARRADASPSRARALPLVEADLHYRGFSRVTKLANQPERYDYEHLLSLPPWEAAAGRYTRFGDVAELVRDVDERLVVLAPGDEMSLVFDGTGLPEPAPGQERTFILRVRGWAKDQDPNTRFSRTVGPLPVGGDEPSRSRIPAKLVPKLAPP